MRKKRRIMKYGFASALLVLGLALNYLNLGANGFSVYGSVGTYLIYMGFMSLVVATLTELWRKDRIVDERMQFVAHKGIEVNIPLPDCGRIRDHRRGRNIADYDAVPSIHELLGGGNAGSLLHSLPSLAQAPLTQERSQAIPLLPAQFTVSRHSLLVCAPPRSCCFFFGVCYLGLARPIYTSKFKLPRPPPKGILTHIPGLLVRASRFGP